MERRKIIMTTTMNAYQGNFMRTELLQLFTLFDGDQPVFRAMQDIGMAIHFTDPLIGPEFKTQGDTMR